jgi:hypothetical protein
MVGTVWSEEPRPPRCRGRHPGRRNDDRAPVDPRTSPAAAGLCVGPLAEDPWHPAVHPGAHDRPRAGAAGAVPAGGPGRPGHRALHRAARAPARARRTDGRRPARSFLRRSDRDGDLGVFLLPWAVPGRPRSAGPAASPPPSRPGTPASGPPGPQRAPGTGRADRWLAASLGRSVDAGLTWTLSDWGRRPTSPRWAPGRRPAPRPPTRRCRPGPPRPRHGPAAPASGVAPAAAPPERPGPTRSRRR